jgi:hypothetical protein
MRLQITRNIATRNLPPVLLLSLVWRLRSPLKNSKSNAVLRGPIDPADFATPPTSESDSAWFPVFRRKPASLACLSWDVQICSRELRLTSIICHRRPTLGPRRTLIRRGGLLPETWPVLLPNNQHPCQRLERADRVDSDRE